jgi:hypothetical protein
MAARSHARADSDTSRRCPQSDAQDHLLLMPTTAGLHSAFEALQQKTANRRTAATNPSAGCGDRTAQLARAGADRRLASAAAPSRICKPGIERAACRTQRPRPRLRSRHKTLGQGNGRPVGTARRTSARVHRIIHRRPWRNARTRGFGASLHGDSDGRSAASEFVRSVQRVGRCLRRRNHHAGAAYGSHLRSHLEVRSSRDAP